MAGNKFVDYTNILNRYGYCLNNPLRYVDETGEWFGIDDLIGAAIGAIGGAASSYASGFVSTLALGGSLSEANHAGLNAMPMGAGLGAAMGGFGGYRYAKKNNLNPWTGRDNQKGSYSVYQGTDPRTGEVKYVG